MSERERALAAADGRLRAAKLAFGRAAAACLAQRPEAEQLVAAALRDVEAARIELHALVDDATELALLPLSARRDTVK